MSNEIRYGNCYWRRRSSLLFTHSNRDMRFSHAAPVTREAGHVLFDEIKRMEDVLERSEAAFSDILDGFRRSIRCSTARLGTMYNATNPFLRLPDEVIALVMMKTPTNRRSKRVEVVVSHVCRRLRHIALSTSALWTQVTATDLTRSMPDMLEAYLTRSNGRLIDVDLGICKSYHGSRRDVDRIMGKICSYAPLWRSFKFSYHSYAALQMPSHGCLDHPLPFLESIHSVPNLQRLELNINLPPKRPFPGGRQPPVFQPLFQQGVPNLSVLVLQTWKFHFFWLLPTLGSLTSLTIGSSRLLDEHLVMDHSQQTPIPILQLLSLPTLHQFALVDGTESTSFPVRLDMTPPHTSTADAQYSRLHSLRIPVQVLPELFSIPQQVFEETTHLFVDVSVTDESFYATLMAAANTHTGDIFPKLGYLTLCCGETQTEFPVEESDILMRMTSSINHLIIMGNGHEMFEGILDHHMDDSPYWPNLVDVYLDLVNHFTEDVHDLFDWCISRRERHNGFVLQVADGYIEQMTSYNDSQYAEELVVKLGIMQEVDGPTLPEADRVWLE